MIEQLLQSDVGVLLQLYNDSNSLPIRFVPNGFSQKLVLSYQIRNLLDEFCLVYHVGYFPYYYSVPFNLNLPPQNDSTLTSFVNGQNSLPSNYHTASWKVWPLYVFHQFLNAYIRIFYIRYNPITNLSQVVWGYVCHHSYSYPSATVYQQIRNLRWQNDRFKPRCIEVRLKVNSSLIDVFEHLFSQFR